MTLSLAALNSINKQFWLEQNSKLESYIASPLARFLQKETQKDFQGVQRLLAKRVYCNKASRGLAFIHELTPINALFEKIEWKCDLQRERSRRPRSVVGPDGQTLEYYISLVVSHPTNVDKSTKLLWRHFLEELKTIRLEYRSDFSKIGEVLRYKTRSGTERSHSYRSFENTVSKIRSLGGG